MQGVRLQSGRTQVLFKKMFPIFVCFGKLRVQGLPWQHPPPPTHRLVTWDPSTFWKLLPIVPMLGPVWELCLLLE